MTGGEDLDHEFPAAQRPTISGLLRRQRHRCRPQSPRGGRADLGAAYGAPVIHLHKLLNTAAKKAQASDLAADGIHPSELGHRIIAQAWLREGSKPLLDHAG
jgi:hypothetical protein